MAKHRAQRRKLYWWQRKRLIQMQVRAWLLQLHELKLDLQDAMEEIKKQKEKNV